MTLILIVLGTLAIIFNTMFMMCCCKAASNADEQSERDFNRLMEQLGHPEKAV